MTVLQPPYLYLRVEGLNLFNTARLCYEATLFFEACERFTDVLRSSRVMAR